MNVIILTYKIYLQSFDGAIPSVIVDIFTLIDAEAYNEERNNFYYIVKESEKVHIYRIELFCYSNKIKFQHITLIYFFCVSQFLTDRILKERLEIETLQDVGTLKNKNFQTKFIKVKTKLQ